MTLCAKYNIIPLKVMDTSEELTACVCLLIQTIRGSSHLSAKTKDVQPSLLEAV